MASASDLASDRADLKGRVLERLCIRGQKKVQAAFSRWAVARSSEGLLPEDAVSSGQTLCRHSIISESGGEQWSRPTLAFTAGHRFSKPCWRLDQFTLQKVAEGAGTAPAPGYRSGFQSQCSQLISACLPQRIFESGDPDGIRPHDLLLEKQAC